MTDLYAQFLELASKLRLPEDRVVEWVDGKVREAQEQEEKKAKKKEELEEKRRQEELEEKRRQEELEEKRRQEELEEKRRKEDREHEVKMAELRTVKQESKEVERPYGKPKIPIFNPMVQDIDLFLENFERQAILAKWRKDEWSSILFNLLQGDALQVLLSLSREDMSDYDKVRPTLLKHFQCTAEGFRGKFREAVPLVSENFETFMTRMKRYFDRWLSLSKVTNWDELVFLLLKEQIFNSCSDELVLFLKDRRPCDLKQLRSLATTFTDARPLTSIARGTKHVGEELFAAVGDVNMHGTNVNNLMCFRCGNMGHIRKDCRVPEYKIKPKSKIESGRTGSRYDNFYPANSAVVSMNHFGEQGTSDQLIFNDDQYVHISASAESVSNNGCVLPLSDASVNGSACKALRDSGCSTIGVHRKFVHPDDYTNRNVTCILFGGESASYPTAKISITTPWYNGIVEAVVLPNPIAGLIIGNVKGVSNFDTYVACPVQTRAQLKYTPETLKSRGNIFNEDHSEIAKLQKEDESLCNWFTQSMTVSDSSPRFSVEHDILYRIFQKDDIVYKTLVVPMKLRQKVLLAAHDSPLSGHFGVTKTLKSIQSEFSWPGLYRDVKHYVRSCHVCQTKPRTTVDRKAPLQPMPLMEEPFQRVVVDLVGPLEKSERDRQAPNSNLKQFQAGDKVLVLLPDINNKLLMKLKGPFTVVRRLSTVIYLIKTDRRVTPFHVNLLRQYHQRTDNTLQTVPNHVTCAAVIQEEDMAKQKKFPAYAVGTCLAGVPVLYKGNFRWKKSPC